MSWTSAGSDEGCSDFPDIDGSADVSSTFDSSWSEVDRFGRLEASTILSKREGRGVISMRALGWTGEGVCGVR